MLQEKILHRLKSTNSKLDILFTSIFYRDCPASQLVSYKVKYNVGDSFTVYVCCSDLLVSLNLELWI